MSTRIEPTHNTYVIIYVDAEKTIGEETAYISGSTEAAHNVCADLRADASLINTYTDYDKFLIALEDAGLDKPPYNPFTEYPPPITSDDI